MLLAQSYIIKQSPAGLYIFFESSLGPCARPEAYKAFSYRTFCKHTSINTTSLRSEKDRFSFSFWARIEVSRIPNPDAPAGIPEKARVSPGFCTLWKDREPPLEYLLFPASTSRHGARPRRGVTSNVYTDMIGSSRFRRAAWRNTS